MTVEPQPDRDVAYLTDVEGSWARLASFLDGNPLASLDSAGRIHVSRDALFVFGGDAIDRGPWSRRIVRALLDVKERQPEQVVLLAGNRDLNKMRLVRELCGYPRRRTPEDVAAGPRPALLRWIFSHSMGAADAFAHRRAELLAEGQAHDDDAVVESYLQDLAPRGELTRYLAQCQLSFQSGATLFVHGGVAEEALCAPPGAAPRALERLDIHRFHAQLAAFYAEQMDAFVARALEPDGTPAWEPLILYQAPRPGLRMNPGSVVYGRMGDALNNPMLPSHDVIAALVRNGVRRLVLGHTPSGDVPSLVRSTQGGAPFELVVADNSRARVESGTQLAVRDAGLSVRGSCILDDGSAHDVDFTLGAADAHTPLGKRTADGSLLTAPIGGHFLGFRYHAIFEVSQRLYDASAAKDASSSAPASEQVP